MAERSESLNARLAQSRDTLQHQAAWLEETSRRVLEMRSRMDAFDAETGPMGSIGIIPGDVPVIALCGEFDLNNADELRQALHSLADGTPRPVVLDLTETTFIDSTALAALVMARKLGLHVSIRNARPAQRRMLEVSGLDEMFELVD